MSNRRPRLQNLRQKVKGLVPSIARRGAARDHPEPASVISPDDGSLTDVAVSSTTASGLSFDRELDQYQLAADELASQERDLRGKMDECRDGGVLLVDYKRYECELRRVQARQQDLTAGREQYIADRDRLAEWGPTDDWVVAGSIVTVRYLDGHRETFVLTERHTDTEYETVSYASPMGQVVRKCRIGDKVSLPAGAPLVIDRITPGFRKPSTLSAVRGSKSELPASGTETRQVPTAATAEEALAKQRCRDKDYRDGLYRRRYDSNIRRINQFVDKLRSQRRVDIPYVAPTYGGERARLLILMQDPGPKTRLTNAGGSGMICLENIDLSAARQKYFLNEAGIDVSEIVAWSAYPWPKPHPQTTASDRDAAEALRSFLSLTPHVEAVILNGNVAKRIWRVLKESSPDAVADIKAYPTFHTSERAINPEQKSVAYIDDVHRDLTRKYAAAARRIHRL
ncbi:hypothetical protein [Gordonia jinghuaiqii]|uniref:hypothetical protein n=1 Tax=Gordonia jinghuaiqii TaxID=2758710 RepID=UPI002948BBFC|nr:hypothetical protein [Gordonia jinghuaiqii]